MLSQELHEDEENSFLTYNKIKQQIILKRQTQMTLRQLDFRNAKYQGYTNRNQLSGFGLLLDSNYTFIASYWNKNVVNGPTLIIYPDSSIIYAYISSNQEDQIIVFSFEDLLIFRHRNFLVIDSMEDKKLWLVKEDGDVLGEESYGGEEERKKRIKEMLRIKKQIFPFFSNYRSFIMEYFKKQNSELLEIYDANRQFMFSFRSQSLFIKLARMHHKIMLTGYRQQKSDNSLQIGRKYTYTYTDTILIEEFIHPESYVEYAYPERPVECIKNLSEYYKKSLTFVNKFLNLSMIDKLKEQFTKSKVLIKERDKDNYAQKLLEDSHNIVSKNKEFSSKKSVTIEDIKKQIQKAKEKSLNKSRNSTITRTTYLKENQEKLATISNSRKQSPIHYLKQPTSPSRFVYDSPEKEERKKESFRREKSKRSVKIYLPAETIVSPKKRRKEEKRQNLQKLTSDYRYIESEIERQTPKASKRRSPYSHKYKYLQELNIGSENKVKYRPPGYF